MEKRYDVVALGELLIDFTQNGYSSQGNYLMEANPGGAPCNVLAMLRKLGHSVAFIGKVGADIWGSLLVDELNELGIETSNLCMDQDIRTTLAFVKNDQDGERSFSFYRNPGADMMLGKEEIKESIIENCKIFHFGSLSMTHEKTREATKYAVEVAKKNQVLVSFDPNLRESLWENLEYARAQIAYGMSVCDILKISDNEIEWFTGEKNYDDAVRQIRNQYEIPLILVSLGKEGSIAHYKYNNCEYKVEMPAFLQKNTVETTGAGDTFDGAVLHFILENGITNMSEKLIEEMLRFANAAASIITTRKGALKVMPAREEIEVVIQS